MTGLATLDIVTFWRRNKFILSLKTKGFAYILLQQLNSKNFQLELYRVNQGKQTPKSFSAQFDGDTDVAVFAPYFQSQMNGKIYMEYETAPNLTNLHISLRKFDDQLVRALPGIHAVSGCDSTSCFTENGRCFKGM